MGDRNDQRYVCGRKTNSIKADAASQGFAGASTGTWAGVLHHRYDIIKETGNSIT